MKDRIKKSIKIDWQKIKPLQPENVKLPYNTQHLKKSLLKYGFSLPFYVWESEGEYYCIDGHHRLDVLNELIAEGHKVPKELNAVEIEAKDRKEAISILVSVFNQKSNPFAEEYLIEFLEVENIDIQEVSIESVNVVQDFSKGLDFNNMTDNDVDIEGDFDPIGTMDGKQRVVFLFDGAEEAESYLNHLKVDFIKRNMAWQVNMSTQLT
jgi:hypothetical protein